MSVFGYALKRVKHFNKDRFEKHIELIHQNTGKSKFYIKLNWIANLITYGVSYTDYFRCNFIELNRKEKNTFFTAKTFYKFLQKNIAVAGGIFECPERKERRKRNGHSKL